MAKLSTKSPSGARPSSTSSRDVGDACPATVPDLLAGLLVKGYHAGLHLGRWYASLDDCFSLAVTEKRTRAEIDALASALSHRLNHKEHKGH